MGTTNLDTLALSGDLTVTGSVTAASIIGTIAENAAFVATPDDGTTQTLTAAMIVGGGAWTYHTSTGGTTPSLTLPLATAIIAGITGWSTGDSYTLRIINLNSGTATIVTNTGVTLTGTATISANSQADFVVTKTGAATVSVVRVNKELSTNGLTITASTGTLTIPNSASLITAGAFAVTLTATNTTGVTLPTTGTLATLAGSEALTNKTVNGLTVTSSTGTLTIPNTVVLTGPAASGTAATLAGSETLTNKTLTAPSVTGLKQNAVTTISAAGTTRTDATALTGTINNLTTVGSGTGVILPAAAAGNIVYVNNLGANAVVVYGAGSDTVDGQVATTGVTLTNTKRAAFMCVAAATWISLMGIPAA